MCQQTERSEVEGERKRKRKRERERERERERYGKWTCVCGFTFPLPSFWRGWGGVGGDGADRTNTHHASSKQRWSQKIKTGTKEKMASFLEPCLETKKAFSAAASAASPNITFSTFSQFTFLDALALAFKEFAKKREQNGTTRPYMIDKKLALLKSVMGGY